MAIHNLSLFLLCTLSVVNISESDDNKYDFEHKVLKSIVELEHDHDVMRYLLGNYQQLEDTNVETAKILETMGQTMRGIEHKLSEMDEINKKTAKALKFQSEMHDDDMEKIRKQTGHVGGSHYTHSGAASNYLCLTKEPTWNEPQVAASWPTYLYGGEYDFGGHTTFGKGFVNLEPPCAVCRSSRPTVIMIPGRNVCHEGWTTEYSGYLVAGHHTHAAASEFICLDISATAAADSDRAVDYGKLMYTVRASCGSLKCPPYKKDWTVTCVVCSK